MKKSKKMLLSFALSCSVLAKPWTDPELLSLLRAKSNEEVTVIVNFTEKTPTDFRNKRAQDVIMAERREIQKDFLDSLKKKNSLITEVTPLWISNSVIVKTKSEEIRNWLQRDDLSSILANHTLQLFEPQKTGSEERAELTDMTYGLKKIRATEVWSAFQLQGEGITVGILDTGYADHPEFKNRVLLSKDFISDYADNQPNDGQGHGSHCMGTIGGGNLSGKHIGVAPKVQFIVGKIFSDSGSTTTEAILKAMQWIADPDQNPKTADYPRVISNSWGGLQGSMEKEKPKWQAVQTWRELGIVPVIAAGNSGSNENTISTPGGFPHSFCIGATDSADEIADFSSRGAVFWDDKPLIKPDLSAPGVDVYSVNNTGGYTKKSGTSMATPHVAGIVALMLQADPSLSVENIIDILEQTSQDLGPSGKDNDFGFGRVDAYKAVEMVLKGAKLRVHVNQKSRVAIRIEPGTKIYYTDANGDLKLSIPAGKYKVQASLFGFTPIEKEIEILPKKEFAVEFSLTPAPLLQASFLITDEGGKPLAGKILFPGIPVEVGETGAQSFDIKIPAGEYEVLARALGYHFVKQRVQITQNCVITLVLKKLPPVLLVDDDNQNTQERWFEYALKGNQIQFDKKTETVSEEEIMGYSSVIWITGSASNTILSPEEEKMLTEYVKSGGRLLLSGQDIGYSIQNHDFFKNFIGASYAADTSKSKSIQGLGMEFVLDGGDGANNQKYPDVFKENGAVSILKYQDGGVAGLKRDQGIGKIILLGFGIEGVSKQEDRYLLLKKLLEVLKADQKILLERIAFAWEKNSLLWEELIGQVEISESTRKLIETHQDKKPFQPIIQKILHP